ncbi:hypothetical protein ACFFKU_15705 [Kineococcus gynurae]|uniref:Uncharacterized protein n=1 Tax=Kineococcus gynurae TaxID=452979 RepID=A0ABV5LT50_9ACTN
MTGLETYAVGVGAFLLVEVTFLLLWRGLRWRRRRLADARWLRAHGIDPTPLAQAPTPWWRLLLGDPALTP